MAGLMVKCIIGPSTVACYNVGGLQSVLLCVMGLRHACMRCIKSYNLSLPAEDPVSRVCAHVQATVHSSISQWLLWQDPVSALPSHSADAMSPTASRVPSAYPAVLLWISGAVVSAGSFVIVLQVCVSHDLAVKAPRPNSLHLCLMLSRSVEKTCRLL